MHLQHRREHENTILSMFVYPCLHLPPPVSQTLMTSTEHSHSGHSSSRDVEFPDAVIAFLQDLRTEACRLIAESGNGRTLLSHECI